MGDGTTPAGITRRQLLGWATAGGGMVVFGSRTAGVDLGPVQPTSLLQLLFGPPPPYAPPPSILVARPDDGLLVSLSFVNLNVAPRSSWPAQLVLVDATKDGFVRVGLPSQSLFEPAVYDTGGGIATPVQPIPALLSGPSRVVLKIPAGGAPVNFDVPTLFNLAAFPLSLSAVAQSGVGVGRPLAEPSPNETAIEAPWRLILSPGTGSAFSTARGPVKRNGRTELWHARAVGRRPDGTADQRALPLPVRAIWTPDIIGDPTGPGWAVAEGTASITPDQRRKIVAATTTTSIQGEAKPADAALLLVSPMGASLDATGAWPERNDIVAWRHRSWLARDNYVKIEEPGFLFPLGFRATKVSITERRIGDGLAFLRKQIFIVVRQPTVAYGGAVDGQPNDGRNLPFKRVTTTTLVTPPLADPGQPDPLRSLGAGEWVRVRGADGGPADFRFQLVLESHDRWTVTADLPLVFVPAGTTTAQGPANPAYDKATMDALCGLYAAVDEASRRTLRLGGQRMAFVPRAVAATEDPALPTFDLVLKAESTEAAVTTLFKERRLNAYPTMAGADVHLEALAPVGGQAGQHTSIVLRDEYRTSSFGAGEVWAAITGGAPKVEVPQQTGGGLAAPAFGVAGLSRAHGPVADLTNTAKGVIEPGNYFPVDKITLLGGIPLKAVIEASGVIPDPRGPDGDKVPKVITNRTPQAFDTLVRWRPAMKKVGIDLFSFEPAPSGPDSRLLLEARFHTDLGTGATSTAVTGELRNCALNFLGAIKQPIERVRFESRNGAKPTIDVQVGKPEFAGDLRFLNELQNYLPALPGGVMIDVTPAGVRAGLTIAIPSVPIGVVLVENLAIGLELDLPFNGEQASLGFSFATREHPFHVTVMALGGGGFLGIGMGMRGLQRMEGSLEFGASVALDLGVASGSVTIMAGIYFKYTQRVDAAGAAIEPAGNTVVITGFVRATGELDVLGLIHVSIEFYLGLTFSKVAGQEGKVEGTARVSVRVEVLMFSASVSVTLHKEFGSGVDPSFGEQITAGDWSSYCAAFAA